MKTTLLILAISAGAALSMTPAQAQDRGGMIFEELDLNNDGQVTLEELEGQQAARFAAADTDGDGALSEAELLARAEERAGDRATRMVTRMLERLDANEDGLIQADEMPERENDRMTRRFERADANEDGAISAEEFEQARSERGGKGGRHGGGKGERGDRG